MNFQKAKYSARDSVKMEYDNDCVYIMCNIYHTTQHVGPKAIFFGAFKNTNLPV